MENLPNTNYIFFPTRTKVSTVCPGLEFKIAAVYGLYRGTDQCELHKHQIRPLKQWWYSWKNNLEIGSRTGVMKIKTLR